jgi:LmbE family N-acetylglucosaminyl deacetylase
MTNVLRAKAAVDATSSISRPPSSALPAVLNLPLGVETFLDWPDRTVAVIADRIPQQTIAAVERFGLVARVLSPDAAPESAHEAGPCTFVLITTEALRHDPGRDLIRAFRSGSPYAPVILLARAAADRELTLVEAMRVGATDVIDPTNLTGLSEVMAYQLTIAGKQRERVLAIGAHPDDIEIGSAGALLNHRRRGDRISLLTLSRGSIGGRSLVRSQESLAAAADIGAQLLMADLLDTRIEEGIETIRLIESVVAALDPTIVYVHSRHDNHQDHRAVHVATLSATRGVPQIYAYQSPSATNEFTPTRFVPIDDVVAEKVQLLGLFGSQSERSYLEPDLIVAGARYWARHLAPRCRYAEPFEVLRSAADATSRTDPNTRVTATGPMASVTRLTAGAEGGRP